MQIYKIFSKNEKNVSSHHTFSYLSPSLHPSFSHSFPFLFLFGVGSYALRLFYGCIPFV